ncbi:MAG: hypothetical protein M1475_05180 [Actinobacteria bacterium]|nr:hypothetical protein [Actinomycetota bacterium]
MKKHNMEKNNYLKRFGFKIFIALTITILIFSALLTVGCTNKKSVKTDTTSISQAQSSESTQGSTSSNSTTTVTSKQATTTSEEIPPDIQQMIAEANKYYNDGQYAEAVSAYRKIKQAVDTNENISANLKKQIIESYSKNFEDSKTITETARMHFGNAMQLEYEKRIDEAVRELEEALKIYPKYQDAIDKLNTIKSLYKLK